MGLLGYDWTKLDLGSTKVDNFTVLPSATKVKCFEAEEDLLVGIQVTVAAASAAARKHLVRLDLIVELELVIANASAVTGHYCEFALTLTSFRSAVKAVAKVTSFDEWATE